MDEPLLNRYFSDECTPQEARQVLTWFATPDGQRYLTNRLTGELANPDWLLKAGDAAPANVENLLETLRHRRDDTVRPFRPESPAPVRIWLRRAAVFGGMLLLAAGGRYAYQQRYPAELTARTNYGQTRTITLPDQSVVTLNGNSELRYSRVWEAGRPRTVWLNGEAFFTVTHQPHHESFTVQLPNRLAVDVLGTRFNVLARPAQTRIVLNSGHIQLKSGQWAANQRVDMQPGDLFETSRTVASKPVLPTLRHRVDAAVYASWQTNKLVFDNTSLGEIIRRLEDTYGLHVTLTDPKLLTQRVSGTIPNQNVTVLLDGLSRLFGLTIDRQQDTILIKPNE